MGVHPNHRKKGLGRIIIHYIKATLVKAGYKSTSLNVDLSNIPARKLYLSEDYQENWIKANYALKC